MPDISKKKVVALQKSATTFLVSHVGLSAGFGKHPAVVN